jgi:Initiator Replication protein
VTQDPIADNPTTTNPDKSLVKSSTAKPSARARAVEKIRSELNIEKWPAIWQPAKSKNKPALRVMEREVPAADGSRVVSRVEVGYTQLGTLSTEEQKMLYVLIKLWEETGKPDTQVFFSTRELARMLKKKGWGTNVIQAITKSLRKLRTIPIEWINSYYDQTKQGAVIVDRRPFTLLGDLRVVERRQDGAVNSSQGYFKFDDHVLTNLQLNYTKPVCIEEFFKLKSEIAQLIYSHIDLMLYDKGKYERRTRELFNDLGLKNAEYAHMYERKRAIERALRELHGIRLSSGVLTGASLEKTADGKDYKVSFSKGSAASLEAAATEKLGDAAGQNVVINNYSERKSPLTEEAEELVRYFYRVFYGVDSHSPQSKETGQALSLVTQHGVEKSRRIVEFAHEEAAKTGYAIQHFGAVLSYVSRALASKDPQRQEGNQAAAANPARPVIDEEPMERGKSRLACLTPEQYEIRFESTKEILFRAQPFLARIGTGGSKLHQRAVRARMIRDLEREVMELVVVDNLTDPEAVRRKLGLSNLPL